MNQIAHWITFSWAMVLINERAIFVASALTFLLLAWVVYRRWIAFTLENEDLIQEYARYAILAGETESHVQQKIHQQRIRRNIFVIGKMRHE